MIVGTMFATLIADIQNLVSKIPEIAGVYGFGSFFRSLTPNDCDLLVIVKSESKNGHIHKDIHQAFNNLYKSINLPIDLVIVTTDEFSTIPLMERENLFPIFKPKEM